jgi:hypothetical protein
VFVSVEARAVVVLAGVDGAVEPLAVEFAAGALRSAGDVDVVVAAAAEVLSALRLRRDFLGAGSLIVVAVFEVAVVVSVAAADSAFFFVRLFFVPESASAWVAAGETDALLSVSDFFFRRLFREPVSLSLVAEEVEEAVSVSDFLLFFFDFLAGSLLD